MCAKEILVNTAFIHILNELEGKEPNRSPSPAEYNNENYDNNNLFNLGWNVILAAYV